MIYCGIDLASETSAVCLLNEAGIMIHEQAISTEAADFEQVLDGHQAVRCVVEASPLAEWVVCILKDLGHEAIIIDPRRAKAVTQTKNKTDKLDARNLARLAQTGWYTPVHRKSAAARLQRTQLQARTSLVTTAQSAGRPGPWTPARAWRESRSDLRGTVCEPCHKIGRPTSPCVDRHLGPVCSTSIRMPKKRRKPWPARSHNRAVRIRSVSA